jgi:hypothetical protein
MKKINNETKFTITKEELTKRYYYNNVPLPTIKETRKWCKALRSGEYKQGTGRLQKGDSFCCLGVACKEFIPEEHIEFSAITYKGIKVMGGSVASCQPHSPKWLRRVSSIVSKFTDVGLTTLNDDVNLTFDEIADILEAIFIYNVFEIDKQEK